MVPICAICRDELVDESNLVVLNCGHAFHQACLERSLEVRMECPVCKTPKQTALLRRLFITTAERDSEDVILLKNKIEELNVKMETLMIEKEKIEKVQEENIQLKKRVAELEVLIRQEAPKRKMQKPQPEDEPPLD